MLPFQPDVKITISQQRALLAWNGEEQILFLGPDVWASAPTLALEIVPLPSEPGVKAGDLATLDRARALIANYLRRLERMKPMLSLNKLEPPPQTVGGVAPVDVRVAHVESSQQVVAWVEDYLAAQDAAALSLPGRVASLLGTYLAEGFTWFVFDVVTIGIETVTNEPIQYRFKTDHLFYPLKITSTVEGSTSIQLLVLTPWLLRKFPGLPISRIELKHDPISINEYDLQYIDKDMHALLKECKEMKLRIWEISGDLKSFDKDLMGYPW